MGRRQLAFGIVGTVFWVAICAARPAIADERCQQLESLAQQYAGVELNPAQRQIKRRMVVWYENNCRRTNRSAEAN